ncbi:MAG: VTT domain-containing protein [Candidatus Nomurabacteria bacterium]
MENILLLISTYSIYILLPLMIVEGPIVTIIASFLISSGVLPVSIILIYILALLGNILGDINYYAIGRFGREKFIKKYGKYIGLHEERVEYIENHYKNNLLKTFLFAKVTEAPIIPTLVAAGIARVDFKKFLGLSATVETFKVLIIVIIGYYFGRFYVIINSYFKNTVFAMGVTLIILILLFVAYKNLKRKDL